MKLMCTYLLRDRKHPENKKKQTPVLKKEQLNRLVIIESPYCSIKGLHMTCRSFHCKHDTMLSKYPVSTPNPHTGDGGMRHHSLSDPSRLDSIPSVILNCSILIAWKVQKDVFTALSAWEVCHRRSVVLKENCAFKTTNFTCFDGELAKETRRSHLILKTHTGTSPRTEVVELTSSQLIWMWQRLGPISCLLTCCSACGIGIGCTCLPSRWWHWAPPTIHRFR